MDPTNKALVNAVHAVANAHLKAAANTLSKAANASGAEKNSLISQLRAELAAAKTSATAATNLNPSMPVQTTTAAAVNRAQIILTPPPLPLKSVRSNF
jgi:hypothetical protein